MTKAITKAASVLAVIGLVVGPMSAFADLSTDGQVTANEQVTTGTVDASSTDSTTIDTASTTDDTVGDTSTSTEDQDSDTGSTTDSTGSTTDVMPKMNLLAAILPPTPTTVTVTPSDPNGWSEYGNAAGGTDSFVNDYTAPIGNGALQLTTANDDNSLVHYSEDVSIPLSDLSQISYETKRLSANDMTNGNATLRIAVDLGNNTTDQLMFEPYYNGYSGQNGWQTWTITQNSGELWSNNQVTYNGISNTSGSGGEGQNVTLSDVLADYPDATVTGFIFSMGTYNDNQVVNVDDLNVVTPTEDTTYDFDPDTASAPATVTVTPSNLQGWEIYTDGNASTTATSTFVEDTSSPLPPGALQLSTPAGSDEIEFDRTDATMTPVSQINLSYATKRVAGAEDAAPSYILGIDKDGASSTPDDILYAYYEPAYNGGSNYDNWNTWTLDQSSEFWSSSSNPGDQMVGSKGGSEGANFFTLQDVENEYPNAKVDEYTINLGSGNDGWVANVDDVVTPSATYDFEQDQATSTGNNVNTSGGNRHNGSGGGGGTVNTGSTGTTGDTGGQVLGAAAYNFLRDLYLGLTGADVTELQTELIAAGYSIPAGATGYFGTQTQAAVALWQAAHNISPTAGYFGPISRAEYAANGGFKILVTPVTSSTMEGCMAGDAFSTTTGQACQ